MKKILHLTAALTFAYALSARSLDFSSVPGVVLDHQDTYYGWFYSTPEKFISDPEILVLSSGDYLASHALAGRESGSDSSGLTSVFRSTDQGATWTQVSSDITGLLRASMIEHNGAVYLMGTLNDDGGGIVIAKSTDHGATWTKSATFTYSGLATPNNPVVFQDRIWSAAGTASVSAPSDAANLLLPATWTRTGGFPAIQASWPGDFIGEGQIVASPNLGLFIMPKVKYEPLTALARVDASTGVVAFDPDHDFASLPGGEKKIGAGYDSVSGRFFALTQPILPVHADSGIASDMIRNSAAILSSTDLYNWKIEKFLLYSSDVEKDGFGYMNFDFDGDDMVLVSRTAWPVGGDDPDRGHDSNLLTFHRIENVRNLIPDHYLAISGNRILRYERTADPKDDNVPLGDFPLGSIFDRAALSSPTRLGQTADGSVYIQESGGRILCFDATGNFLHTTNASPVMLQPPPLTISQPAGGTCAWTTPESDDWTDPLNWYYWNRADTSEEVAVFGSAASTATSVTIPSISKEYLFGNADELSEWLTRNITNAVVNNGTYQATPVTTDPYIYRTDQSFFGNEVPEIKVRMKASANTTLQFYWGTAAANSFSGTRVVTAPYTGNGEFQTLTFSLAGHAQWDGQLIKRIRVDPVNGSLAAFEIDSITVKEIPTYVKGLQFRNSQSYTLSGSGFISIKADSGKGSIHVFEGRHEIQVPIVLESDTDAAAESGTTLVFSGGMDLNGNTLSVSGSGNLTVTNSFSMAEGTLSVTNGSVVAMNVATGDFNGTLEFNGGSSFSPEIDDTFKILAGSIATNRFAQLSLPVLKEGLGWDTSMLYDNGTITVISAIPDTWRAEYGLADDGSEDFIDSDGDNMDNFSEWKAGTDPKDPQSFFSIAQDPSDFPNGFKLLWNSLSGRTYRVESATNLLAIPAFQTLTSGISGVNSTTEFVDTNAVALQARYYRIIIE
ncbi:sialidase family protein [Tichowtungia aerotolerans]|uniref:Exo-alpha-sialidase n=1 Tax=Tichowtungia aerotolerans TaxID=2697043 RepID=A0A6P1M7Q8_9BACT|nr:sialidase family protein [Tichowtungia aerotolerans]QHI70749.1 hypothetical protein GT409_15315 [Tichowtungia aerotolerans]